MLPPRLEGERVLLRPLSVSDLPFCLAFANDPGLRGLLRFTVPVTREEERAWLAGLDASRQGPTWLMTEPGTGRPLGLVSLTEWSQVARHAELGLGVLRPEDRGRGLGEEAIRLALAHGFSPDGMNLQRVHLSAYDHNPARRLYERLGFRHEGTLRRHAYKMGAYRDVHHYGLLREEWSP